MIHIKVKKIYIYICILFIFCISIYYEYEKLDLQLFSPKQYVYVLGDVIGIKAETSGVMVLNNEENIKYIDSIDQGDNILYIDGHKVNNSQQIYDILNKLKKDSVDVTFERNDKIITKSIKTKKQGESYKLGLWVRDKISGIGTMTCYNPEKKIFYAIGHPIYDSDIKKLLKIKQGYIYNSSNLKILKGSKQNVGKIKANFDYSKKVGNFKENSQYGIKGNLLTEHIYDKNKKLMQIGSYKKIKEGKAKIFFRDKDNSNRYYDILVKNIDIENKNFEIEIVDKDLIEYTGGIIQGMSGTPIIQDNRLIGSIGYVMNNNPKKGFGIFIEEIVK